MAIAASELVDFLDPLTSETLLCAVSARAGLWPIDDAWPGKSGSLVYRTTQTTFRWWFVKDWETALADIGITSFGLFRFFWKYQGKLFFYVWCSSQNNTNAIGYVLKMTSEGWLVIGTIPSTIVQIGVSGVHSQYIDFKLVSGNRYLRRRINSGDEYIGTASGDGRWGELVFDCETEQVISGSYAPSIDRGDTIGFGVNIPPPAASYYSAYAVTSTLNYNGKLVGSINANNGGLVKEIDLDMIDTEPVGIFEILSEEPWFRNVWLGKDDPEPIAIA